MFDKINHDFLEIAKELFVTKEEKNIIKKLEEDWLKEQLEILEEDEEED